VSSLENPTTFEQPYINKHFNTKQPPNQDLIIQSATGTGKTTFVSQLSLNCYQSSNILSITNRVALSFQQMSSFREAGLEFLHYQMDSKKMARTSNGNYKAICQVNSLPKYRFQKVNLLYLDETSSLLRYLVSGAVHKEDQVISEFIRILKTADRVICTDADLDQESVDLITHYRPDFEVYQNTFKNAKGKIAYFSNDYKQVKTQIEDLIANNEFPIICCDTKAMAKQWEAYCAEKSIPHISHHSDSLVEKTTLINVNEAWLNKVVIYSPSVETGIDYTADKRNVFFLCYANEKSFGETPTTTPRSMGQMIARARRLDNVYIYWNGLNKAYDKSYETFCEEQNNYQKSNKSLNGIFGWNVDDDDNIVARDHVFRTFSLKTNYYDEIVQCDQIRYLKNVLDFKGFQIETLATTKILPSTNLTRHSHLSYDTVEHCVKLISQLYYRKPVSDPIAKSAAFDQINGRIKWFQYENRSTIPEIVIPYIACPKMYDGFHFYRKLKTRIGYTGNDDQADLVKNTLLAIITPFSSNLIQLFDESTVLSLPSNLDNETFKKAFRLRNQFNYHDRKDKLTIKIQELVVKTLTCEPSNYMKSVKGGQGNDRKSKLVFDIDELTELISTLDTILEGLRVHNHPCLLD
jgi:hypothetical protein